MNKDGITININSAKALNRVVGHEITHILEGTDLYDSLAMAVAAYAKTKGEYDSRLQQIRELYKDKEGYTGEDAEAKFKAELIADLVGDYLFTDKQFVEKLFNEDRGLFNWIRKQINYIHSLCKAGSKEARQLEKAKKMFTEVVREASKNGVKNPTGEGGVKYSLGNITDVNGKNYGVGVHLDSTLLDNLTPKERVGMVKEYVKELGGDSFTAYDPNGNAVDITIAKANARFRNQRGKKVWANKDLTTKRINNEVKQEAIALVDELITTAEYDTSSTPRYPHDWLDNNGQNDWEYWTTYIQDKNNTIWEVTLNVANSVNGEKILYDISPIKKVGQSVKSVTIPTKNSIRNPSGNVNNQNSSSTPQNSSSTPDTTSLSAPGQVETAGGGWDVRGQDVGLPMPEGYQESPVAVGANEQAQPVNLPGLDKSQPQGQGKAQEVGLSGLEQSHPQQNQQPSRTKVGEDGTLPGDAVRAEQQSLDAEFRRQMGDDSALYDPDEGEGVETVRDKLEVQKRNQQWALSA